MSRTTCAMRRSRCTKAAPSGGEDEEVEDIGKRSDLVAVTMRLRRPRENEHERAQCSHREEGAEGDVPAGALHEEPEAPARDDRAQVTEETGEPGGGRRGALGREVGGGDADQRLRPIDEKSRQPEQQ